MAERDNGDHSPGGLHRDSDLPMTIALYPAAGMPVRAEASTAENSAGGSPSRLPSGMTTALRPGGPRWHFSIAACSERLGRRSRHRHEAGDGLRRMLSVDLSPVDRLPSDQDHQRDGESNDDQRRDGQRQHRRSGGARLRPVRWDQLDPDSVHGVEIAGSASGLTEFRSQRRQVDIHSAISAAVRLSPYLGQDFSLGDHLSDPICQEDQQIELLRTEVEGATRQRHVARCPIDAEFTQLQRRPGAEDSALLNTALTRASSWTMEYGLTR